jgi:small subunit ribosomal protein S9
LSSTGTPIVGTQTWFLGTGRRKEPVARVFLRPGSGKFTVNRRTVEQYFPNHAWKHDAIEPLKFTNIADQVDVVVTAHGGGVGGQAGAVRMGLSRAISRFNPELRPALRKNGFLTQEVRTEGRAQALPVHEALIFRAGQAPSLRTPAGGRKPIWRDHGRQGAGKRLFCGDASRHRKQLSY